MDSIADPADMPEVKTLNAAHDTLIYRIEHGQPTGFTNSSFALAAAEWMRGEAIGLAEIAAWIDLHQAVIEQTAKEHGREYVRLKVSRDEHGHVQYRASTLAPALRMAELVLQQDEA